MRYRRVDSVNNLHLDGTNESGFLNPQRREEGKVWALAGPTLSDLKVMRDSSPSLAL